MAKRPIVEDETFKKAEEQVQLAAYFAKAFMEEMGKKKALEVIGRAYQNYMVDVMAQRFENVPADPKARMEALANRMRQAEKERSDLKVKEITPTRVAIEIRRCPVYEVYTKYGIGEVCQKWCDSDHAAAKSIHPRVKLVRDKEIAYGAAYCNHSWVLEQ